MPSASPGRRRCRQPMLRLAIAHCQSEISSTVFLVLRRTLTCPEGVQFFGPAWDLFGLSLRHRDYKYLFLDEPLAISNLVAGAATCSRSEQNVPTGSCGDGSSQ